MTALAHDLSARSAATAVPCYGDDRIAIVRGEGCRLFDADGRAYLDLLSGIAVACLGHAHPAIRDALAAQAGTLVHCSNLFVIEPQVRLAEWLCARTFAERVFFCNSGAEANEAAIKLARRVAHAKGEDARVEIVGFEGSFHGRTLGAMSITGQAKVRTGFGPLLPGAVHVPFADEPALRAAVGPSTAAVILEPIQGEGGVRPFPDAFLHLVRDLCDEHGALMICDEVQTGMGRTGRLFAHEHAGVSPDAVTVGKGLGGGVPIGALLTNADAAGHLGPGTHGTTFGGNPLVCAAALAVGETIEREGLIERAAALGAFLRARLDELAAADERITDVRGRGLMVGVELNMPAAPVVTALRDAGVIAATAGERTIRLLPPLVATERELRAGTDAMSEALARTPGP